MDAHLVCAATITGGCPPDYQGPAERHNRLKRKEGSDSGSMERPRMLMNVRDVGNTMLDTEIDMCLYQAPRDPVRTVFERGRDLYVHTREDLPPIFYLYRWSRNTDEHGCFTVIPEIMASRFLEERGLLCHDIGDHEAAMALRKWGYGILEEF